MRPETLSLLCDPISHEPLQLSTGKCLDGRTQEVLINPKTGRRFPLRDGIVQFCEEIELSGLNKKYVALYNRTAQFYDLATKLFAYWKDGGEEKRRLQYLSKIEVQPDGKLLEVSIGTGINLRYLPRNVEYFGLDISWKMLRRCQRNIIKWGIRAELFLGMAERLPFKDTSFDAILHVGGINFFNDRSKALSEIVRVAKPGTKVVVVDETEQLAEKYERTPITGTFYKGRLQTISAPVDLIPPGMMEVKVESICRGELYCLSFRKP